ncbi:MAG: hypothetical protein HYX90_10525, partial [Chloroflexi bacterium]|nr:hypothetical protein [Chloroflexota bacterium]
ATFKLKDGSEKKATVDAAKGTNENPMTPDELKGKYRLLAGHTISADKVNKFEKAVEDLESLKDVTKLGELLLA